MADLNVPTETLENQETIKLSKESEGRVNIVAKNAVTILEKNPDAQSAVSQLFGEMVSKNLRDPEAIGKIQDGLYEARDTRLATASPSERLSILTAFTQFMERFTQGIAQMNRDVGLSNEANTLKNGSDIKVAQVQATYAQILANNHPLQTA